MGLKVSLVVPTLGRSPWLGDCLRALRREAGRDGEVIAVVQGGTTAGQEAALALAHRRIDAPRPMGFAAAADRGIAAAEAPWVALVNDDAVVEPGWLEALLAALESEPRAAAAQGVNLLEADPARCDGWGLVWNTRLQAIQLGHGEPAPEPSAPVREVFGVSATAALFRRAALLEVAAAPSDPEGRRFRPVRARPADEPRPVPPAVFDPSLGTYYEDADLAVRLRAAGWRALSVPAARARHVGSATTGAGAARWCRVYGNRHLVVSRALGRAYWRRVPGMLAGDAADLIRAAGQGQAARAAGILGGWARAAGRLPGFAHAGPPLLPPEALAAREPGRPRHGRVGP